MYYFQLIKLGIKKNRKFELGFLFKILIINNEN